MILQRWRAVMSWTIRLLACCTLVVVNWSAAGVLVRPKPYLPETLTAKLIENSLGMKLVLIDPGTFLMGSPLDEEGRHPSETQHEVEISKPFYIGKFEVTQEEYEKVTGKNPSNCGPNGQDKAAVALPNTKRFPVEMVSWQDARAFCRKLTERERASGRITETMQYTLPTEAEWEYCCRAGTRTPFHFGATL